MRPTSSEAAGRVAFRYPNYRYYLTARFLVTISSEMQAVAVGWQVYDLTHQPLDLGLVGLVQFLPSVLLFLVAGHAADKFPRLRIVQACFTGFGAASLLLAVFTLRGLGSVYPIYAALVVNGVVRAFHTPAGQALLPLLVPEQHFQNAVAWSSSVFQVSAVIGPMIGGLVYAWTGSAMPVYAAAMVAYMVALGVVSAIRIQAPRAGRRTGAPGLVLDGLRYIRRHELILGAISLDLFAVLLGGAVALLPVYAREILNIGASGLGLLRSAPAVGEVLTAILVAHWPLRRRVGIKMLSCVAGFGALTIVFGLSRNLALSLAALLLAGGCDMVSIIVRHTLVQLATPDEMRGRVSAVNMLFLGASNEVGQFESGVTAQWFGTVPAVILGGAGTILVVATWAWRFPALRRMSELTPQPANR